MRKHLLAAWLCAGSALASGGEWGAIGGGNPVPEIRESGGVLELIADGKTGDDVAVRDYALTPGDAVEFDFTSEAGNAPDSYAYVALRSSRNGGNLVLHSIPAKPGETVRVRIENDGRFLWFDRVSMLICLHDAEKPMRVKVGEPAFPGSVPLPEFRDSPEAKRERVQKLRSARTVQIDTGFPYYQNRSGESIAAEIAANGFGGVYYFMATAEGIRPEVIQALQRRGIPVALMTLPSLVYPSEATLDGLLPPGWRDWLIKFTGNQMDVYRFIGFVYPEYTAWYKKYLNEMLTKFNFDGFTFAEIMYPLYDGPEQNPPFYGDVSEGFQAAFRRATGNGRFPNFTDPAHPDYFRTNTALYRELVEFRVRTINDFYDDVVNAPDGARAAAPGILFATWTLGINIPDGVDKLREWEGNDIGEMIRRVKPDMHFIQTHAPDWSNPELAADYPLSYKPFFDAIRNADPKVGIAMQADLGSLAAARRDHGWVGRFYEACAEAKVGSTTFYEFALRYAVYSDPPRLTEVRALPGGVRLVFDQRLDRNSAKVMEQRELTGRTGTFRIQSAQTDGNLIDLKLDRIPAVGEKLTIPTGAIMDDPTVRFPSSHLPPLPRGPVNIVPDDAEVTLEVLPADRL